MTVLRFAGFELDQQRAELRGADGGAIKLRPKTFDMLRLFATNPGRVLGKQELMDAVWPNVHVGEDSLFQCIRELRAALGDDRRQMIKLASGGGYLLTAAVSVEPAVAWAAPDAARPIDADVESAAPAEIDTGAAKPRRAAMGFRRWTMPAAAAILCAIIGIAGATAALRADLFRRTPPVIAVMPIVDASSDPQGARMAGEITDRLVDGFAKIGDVRIVAPQSAAPTTPGKIAARGESVDFEIRGELQRDKQAWSLRARIIKTATGEVQSVASISVEADEPDLQLQQSRLTAGVGYQLARRLNELLLADSPVAGDAPTGARVAIEQAIASINNTTRERFGMAETMLQKALADDPGNTDVAVALAALQLRGIQLAWFSPDESAAVEARASATLEHALRAKPDSIAVLEAYCRLLSATNRFVESLVTCARVLNFDPWDGGALYLIGLGQLNLGRFEDALATFKEADSFNTPPVSRWTWLLGAGWTELMLGHNEEAVPWLQRSIAITPASGRSYMMLAAAFQGTGRLAEARAAMQEGLKQRPGTTELNVLQPTKNSSPVFLQAAGRVIQLMIDAGLPRG